jgi:hypothetical protein
VCYHVHNKINWAEPMKKTKLILENNEKAVYQSYRNRHKNELLDDGESTYLPLLVEISRKMLSCNASIKAGTTSLLSNDLLWGPLNQQEILQIIDSSTDELSELLALFSLALRSEGKLLKFHVEASPLEEIFIHLNKHLHMKYSNFELNIDLPIGGKPAYVDYEYLVLALMYLIDVVKKSGTMEQLNLKAIEYEDHWQVIIEVPTADAWGLLKSIFTGQHIEMDSIPINTVDLLQLQLVKGLLYLQKINIILIDELQEAKLIRLNIPVSS